MFHIITDSHVILRSKGVFRQATVYHFQGHIFAKWGTGYIRLARYGTSVPGVDWCRDTLDIQGNKNPKYDKMGYVIGSGNFTV